MQPAKIYIVFYMQPAEILDRRTLTTYTSVNFLHPAHC
jgi:hypothetical protein